MLDRVLGQAGVELGQIELFAVATGPGSFTGLRVGLTAVKGWAEVLGRPIAAVSVLEAVAVQAQGDAHLLAAVIDARGGQIFGGIFRREGADGRLAAMGGGSGLERGGVFSVGGASSRTARVPLFVTTTPEAVKAGLAAFAVCGRDCWRRCPGELAPFIGRLGLAR